MNVCGWYKSQIEVCRKCTEAWKAVLREARHEASSDGAPSGAARQEAYHAPIGRSSYISGAATAQSRCLSARKLYRARGDRGSGWSSASQGATLNADSDLAKNIELHLLLETCLFRAQTG